MPSTDHVRAMLAFQAGSIVFDYGNNLRAMAKDAGVEDAFAYPVRRRMSAGSPDSATQRKGPRPSQNWGRMNAGTKPG